MLLIYIALFMTVILTFWGMQVYTYNSNVDRAVMSNFAQQMMTLHNQAVETTRDSFLGGSPTLDDILADPSFVSYPIGSEELIRRCYDINDSLGDGAGAPQNCYDPNGIYALDFDTSMYDVITRITSDATIGWVQEVTFVHMTGSTMTQRDLNRAFVDNLGYNLQMGIIQDPSEPGALDSNGDYIVNTGLPGVTDRRVSDTVLELSGSSLECIDSNGECFVLITDLYPLPAVADQQIIVDITEVPESFTYNDGGGSQSYLGVNMAMNATETLNFTVTDGLANSPNAEPSVELFITISGYDNSGEMVPSIDGDPSHNGFNPNLVDLEDLVFINNSGLEVTNENAEAYTHDMTIDVTPNYNQVGGAYITITAIYTGTDGDDNSVIEDSTTFLILIEDDYDTEFECDGDGDGVILEVDDGWEQDSAGNWLIGSSSDSSDTNQATAQLLCLSHKQYVDSPNTAGEKILTGKYLMITDADFGNYNGGGINFTVTKRYMNINGSGNSSTKTNTYSFLKSISSSVSSNTIDWTGDGIVGTGASGWVPLGGSTIAFTGTFNGGNHTISNIYMDHESSYSGFFGNTNKSTISNLSIVDSALLGEDSCLGGLVGQASWTTIEASSVDGDISGEDYVGGLVGCSMGAQINNSYATGDVYGSVATGGLIGYMYTGAKTSNSHATGAVTGTSSYTGGLVGWNNGGNMGDKDVSGNNYASGSVSGQSYVGGLAGYANGEISDSYSRGDVRGTAYYVGGITGVTHFNISNVSAEGDVNGYGYVGGLVGSIADSAGATLSLGESEGDVSSTHDVVGGAVGYVGAYNYVENTSAIGNVQSSGGLGGGLVGWATSMSLVSHSYATGNVSGTWGLGGAIGYMQNCNAEYIFATGDVNNSGTYSGGLVGVINNGVVKMAYATGNVSGDNTVGGLWGQLNAGQPLPEQTSHGEVANVYATGKVSASGGTVGGLGGASVTYSNPAYTAKISNAYATGDVSGYDSVAGLVGAMFGTTVYNAYTTGNVSGTLNVGGISGTSARGGDVDDWTSTQPTDYRTYVTGVFSTGSVYGNTNVGGITGWGSHINIDQSYKIGLVSGGSGLNIGGLVGSSKKRWGIGYGLWLQNSYSTARVAGGRNVGGLLGYAPLLNSFRPGSNRSELVIISSYSNNTTSGVSTGSVIGTIIGGTELAYRPWIQNVFGTVSPSNTVGAGFNLTNWQNDRDLCEVNTCSVSAQRGEVLWPEFEYTTTWNLSAANGSTLQQIPNVTINTSGKLSMDRNLNWDSNVWSRLNTLTPTLKNMP